MRTKPYQKEIHIFEHKDVISIFTNYKKSHFISESKLYAYLDSGISAINSNYGVHLTTYPNIAVHVTFGLANGLLKDKDRIKNMVVNALKDNLKI